MSLLPSFMSSAPPSVGLEIASDRVTAVSLGRQANANTVAAYAVQPLPAGAITPTLNAVNIHNPEVVATAVRTALAGLGGRHRRVALVIPDTAAKISLLRFEKVPSSQTDLDQLIRWQVRKTAPFKPEEAEVSWVAGATLGESGREFLVTHARRDILESYQEACAAAGSQAGIVDLASLNLINAVLAGSAGSHPADWLVVHVAPDYATLAIVRDRDLIYFRTRQLDSAGDLAELVHQTSMYYEDRLSGSRFARVLLSGAAARSADGGERARRALEERLGVRVEPLDFRGAATMVDRIGTSPELLDVLAPAVGVILRERVA
jgi:type IV pilus assembly protein PilM